MTCEDLTTLCLLGLFMLVIIGCMADSLIN